MFIHFSLLSSHNYYSLFTSLSKTWLCWLRTAELLNWSSKRWHRFFLDYLSKLRIWEIKVLVISCRALCGKEPAYIKYLLQLYATSRSLRSSDKGLLVALRCSHKNKGDCTFKVVALSHWKSVETFKKQLKIILFRLWMLYFVYKALCYVSALEMCYMNTSICRYLKESMEESCLFKRKSAFLYLATGESLKLISNWFRNLSVLHDHKIIRIRFLQRQTRVLVFLSLCYSGLFHATVCTTLLRDHLLIKQHEQTYDASGQLNL